MQSRTNETKNTEHATLFINFTDYEMQSDLQNNRQNHIEISGMKNKKKGGFTNTSFRRHKLPKVWDNELHSLAFPIPLPLEMT